MVLSARGVAGRNTERGDRGGGGGEGAVPTIYGRPWVRTGSSSMSRWSGDGKWVRRRPNMVRTGRYTTFGFMVLFAR